MDRVKTGIQGLDKALEGGIPKNNVVLVSGGAGTGKSTLCLQYLYNGAKTFGEKGIYFSTEQTEKELKRHAATFGWDLEELQKKNLLRIHYFDVVKGNNLLQKIYDSYSDFEPKRIVIDSLTTFTDSLLISGMSEDTAFSTVQIAETVSPIPRTEQVVAKTLLYHLMKKLKLFDSTVLMTSELIEGKKGLSADQVSEFICDGVMVLNYLGVGSAEFRSMLIRKMRYSWHEKDYIMYDIEKAGVVIKKEEIFKPQ